MYASSSVNHFTRTLKDNVINYSNFIFPAAVPIWVKLLMNKLGKILTSQEGMKSMSDSQSVQLIPEQFEIKCNFF